MSTTSPSTPRRRLGLVLLVAVSATSTGAALLFRTPYPERELARGTQALQNHDWVLVEQAARDLEAAGATDHAAVLRGELLLALGRPEAALREFNTVRSDGPLQLRAASRSGRCLLDLGDLREAHRVLTFVAEQTPDDADAHRGLASIAYDLGQMSTAVVHLERVAALDPADPRPHRLIGLIYKDLTQTDKADVAYTEAIRRGLAPAARAEVAMELAQTRLDALKYAEALAALDSVPATPEAPEATAARIESLRGLGETKTAAILANRMVAATPNFAPFRRLRGQLHLDAGELTEAVADLEQAAALAPTHYQTHFLLSQVYTAIGRRADAERVGEKARQLRADLDQITALTTEAIDKPWDATVRRHLADVADRLGNPKLAASWRAAAAACTVPPR